MCQITHDTTTWVWQLTQQVLYLASQHKCAKDHKIWLLAEISYSDMARQSIIIIITVFCFVFCCCKKIICHQWKWKFIMFEKKPHQFILPQVRFLNGQEMSWIVPEPEPDQWKILLRRVAPHASILSLEQCRTPSHAINIFGPCPISPLISWPISCHCWHETAPCYSVRLGPP